MARCMTVNEQKPWRVPIGYKNAGLQIPWITVLSAFLLANGWLYFFPYEWEKAKVDENVEEMDCDI